MLFKAHLPKDAGCVVHEASDLAGALRLAAEVRPDLVVLDYNMPDKNGVEIARELIAQGVKAKLALLTANTQAAVVEEANDSGFFTIVEKPITAAKLARLIAEAAA